MEINYKDTLESFTKLLKIMDELRDKCPWDREQTFHSLRNLTIEETYELSQALVDLDYQDIKKELGDILLHIVFYSKIASQENKFDIKDVIDSLNEKLIRRHPHIYSDAKAEDSNMVKENWEDIKLKEGPKSVLSGVPDGLPALIKAYRIQEKVQGVGFDWKKPEHAWAKVEEEKQELEVEINSKEKDIDKISQEFGDLLFSLVNYSRFIGVDPELALEKTNKKFIKRFKFIEKEVNEKGKNIRKMSLEDLDLIWNKAKKEE